jgi:hypothetical protein
VAAEIKFKTERMVYRSDGVGPILDEYLDKIERALPVAMDAMLKEADARVREYSPRSLRRKKRKARHFQELWKTRRLKAGKGGIKGILRNNAQYADYLEDPNSGYPQVAVSAGNPDGRPSPLAEMLKDHEDNIFRIAERILLAVRF